MIEVSLRTFLVSNNVIANANGVGQIQYGKIQEATSYPVIWFNRQAFLQDLSASGVPLLAHSTFNVECIANDPEIAQTAANTVRALLHGYQGTFGTDYAKAIFVDDQNDDYVPYNADNDNGVYVAALVVEIIS